MTAHAGAERRGPRLPRIGPRALAAALLAAGLGTTIFVVMLLGGQADQRSTERADRAVRGIEADIERHFESQVEVLYGLRSFVAVTEPTRAEFRDFLEGDGVLDRRAGVQALEWAPLVPRSSLDDYQSSVRADRSVTASGNPDFTVRSDDSNRDLVVVDYIEPMTGNEAAWGFDLMSNPDRRAAIEQARTSGEPVATAPITLVQETGEQSGVLLFVPVFTSPGAAGTSEDGFAGVVLAVYRTGDLIASSVSEASVPFTVADAGTAERAITDGQVLFATAEGGTGEPNSSGPKGIVEVGGRAWSITLADTALEGSSEAAVLAIAIIGTIASLAIAAYVLAIGSVAEVAERRAEALTFDIRAANRALEAREQQLQTINEQLLSANTSLSEFNRVASHDLRSPLRGIRTLTQFAREDAGDDLPAEVTNHLDRIDERSNRMSELIDGLLEYSRSGHLSRLSEEVAIRELVEGIFTTVTIDDNITRSVETEVELVNVQVTPLALCLRNLIDNALKHHPGPTGSVNVRITEPSGEMIQIDVTDDGAGIEETYLERIFEPFFRIDATEGSGIGLAVIRKTADLHGGSIDVTSEPGVGTTFSLHWPTESEPAATQEHRRTEEAVPAGR
ncbi:MAG: CHASE domain-containing protein [Actinomycetota bacterium]